MARMCSKCGVRPERRKNAYICSQCHNAYMTEYLTKLRQSGDTRFRLKSILTNARRRKECSLSVQNLMDLWEQQEGRCAYCNVEMTTSAGGREPTTVSLDRVDPSLPYYIENVVLACWSCNAAKGEASYQEFIEWCKRIAERYGEDA